MRFSSIYQDNKFVLSYELFPPKTDKGMANLEENLKRLLTYNPHFITCTYGAGGSTRDRTLTTLETVRKLTEVPLASHLTCVQATADDIRAYVRKTIDAGVDNIVAIRGDIPEGEETFTVTQGGFAYANELVDLLHTEFPDLGIGVGGYPEVHPEAESLDVDIDNLKRKVDAGADIIITQLFFDNDDFYRFRDRCVTEGISIPIIPGIMPITSGGQLTKVTSLGASRPSELSARFEAAGDDKESQFTIGIDFAIAQTNALLKHGVRGLHFYVLNQSKATMAVLHELHPLH
ncbi:MAG: methylenetetrahydrofolate reductase [NAD(P)H] [Candidatus Hydrogenedentota bacterium]